MRSLTPWTGTTISTRRGPTCCAGWGDRTRRPRPTTLRYPLSATPLNDAFSKSAAGRSRDSGVAGDVAARSERPQHAQGEACRQRYQHERARGGDGDLTPRHGLTVEQGARRGESVG